MSLINTDFSKIEMRVLAMTKSKDVAPPERVGALMTRLEQTIPFPVNVEEFYSSLFPPGFMAFAATREFNIPLRNVRTVVTSGITATVMVGPDTFVRCTFSKPMPVPRTSVNDKSNGLIVCPNDHPLWDQIRQWHSKASAFEIKVGAAEAMMMQVLGSPALPAWGELHKAIRTKPGRVSKRATEHLSDLMDPETKKEYDDLLATALLLPETKTPHAWVGLLGR
jgi:hypothetical protein